MSWEAIRSGKVRDVYEEKTLGLIALVASDRVSAFDKVLAGNGIPDKGKALTAISNYWAVRTATIANAYIWDLDIIEAFCRETDIDKERVTIQRKTETLPVEAIVRGYISGSAWSAYEKGERQKCGVILPDGLLESSRLPNAIFTPTTKDEHDEDITFDEMAEIFRKAGFTHAMAEYVRKASLDLYHSIYYDSEAKGLILADVKFEFGIDEKTGSILVIDEIATPDSSRYWSIEGYEPGKLQDSFDKEHIRQYIRAQKAKGIKDPVVSPEIVQLTSERYQQLQKILLGD